METIQLTPDATKAGVLRDQPAQRIHHVDDISTNFEASTGRLTPSTSTTTSSSSQRHTHTIGITPSSVLLQDLLREKKAQTHKKGTPKGAQRRKSSLAKEALTGETQSSTMPKSQRSVRIEDVKKRQNSSPSGGGSKGSMCAREMEKYISKLHKQNFDLKLEVYHRRKRCMGLEDKLTKFEDLEGQIKEIQDANEQLLIEIDRRDKAIEEAVGIICELEEKVERMEEAMFGGHLPGQITPTQNDTSPLRDIFPHSSLPEAGGGGIYGHNFPESPTRGPITDQTHPDPHLTSPKPATRINGTSRTPYFLADPKKSGGALRSLYLAGELETRSALSFLSVSRRADGSASHKDRPMSPGRELDALHSPTLSVLSESSFLSVYGDKVEETLESDDETTWKGERDTRKGELLSDEDLEQPDRRRKERALRNWMASRSSPSKVSQKGSPHTRRALPFQSLGEALGDSIVEPSLNNVGQDEEEPVRSSPKTDIMNYLASRRKYTGIPSHVSCEGFEEKRSHSSMKPIFGADLLPPTPDTMSTVDVPENPHDSFRENQADRVLQGCTDASLGLAQDNYLNQNRLQQYGRNAPILNTNYNAASVVSDVPQNRHSGDSYGRHGTYEFSSSQAADIENESMVVEQSDDSDENRRSVDFYSGDDAVQQSLRFNPIFPAGTVMNIFTSSQEGARNRHNYQGDIMFNAYDPDHHHGYGDIQPDRRDPVAPNLLKGRRRSLQFQNSLNPIFPSRTESNRTSSAEVPCLSPSMDFGSSSTTPRTSPLIPYGPQTPSPQPEVIVFQQETPPYIESRDLAEIPERPPHRPRRPPRVKFDEDPVANVKHAAEQEPLTIQEPKRPRSSFRLRNGKSSSALSQYTEREKQSTIGRLGRVFRRGSTPNTEVLHRPVTPTAEASHHVPLKSALRSNGYLARSHTIATFTNAAEKGRPTSSRSMESATFPQSRCSTAWDNYRRSSDGREDDDGWATEPGKIQKRPSVIEKQAIHLAASNIPESKRWSIGLGFPLRGTGGYVK